MKLVSLIWHDESGRQWNAGFSIDDLVRLLAAGFNPLTLDELAGMLDDLETAFKVISIFYQDQRDFHRISEDEFEEAILSNFERVIDKWTIASICLANTCKAMTKEQLHQAIQDGKRKLAIKTRIDFSLN